MLDELDQPTFVEIIEKSSNVGVQNVIHLLPQKRIRQRVQRLMLATPRAKSVREAEKVFLVDLVEDGDHSLLNDLVLQRRDPQRAFPPVFFLYVHSSRWHRSVRPAMDLAVKIDKSIFSPSLILLPRYTVHSGCSFSFQRIKAFPQQIDGQMVEQGGELHLLILPRCIAHTRQPL